MRLSQGSRSSFCSAGPPSLAPRPRPPYFVVVGSAVFRYESYCIGQFWPHTLGSIVSSLTSTSRTNVCRASCLRSKMFVSSASSNTVSPATPTSPITARSQPRFILAPLLAARAVTGAGVAVHAIERAVEMPGRLGNGLHEALVAAHAVHTHHLAVLRRDLDRLLEVLQRERGRMPEAVVGLRHPFRQARVRQMTLDARGRVAMAAHPPAVVLRVHDVTVHAGSRVGGQIGEPLRVDERERTDTRGNSEQAGEEHDQS